MEHRSDYLLDLSDDGLSVNGLACGITPTPTHLKAALGEPSRILPVKPEIAANRERWVFDELGITALVEDGGTVLHDICAHFETGFERWRELAEPMPQKPFVGTVRLGRYRLRQGFSFIAAMEVEKVRLNGFRVLVSEHRDRVATCDIAMPLLS